MKRKAAASTGAGLSKMGLIGMGLFFGLFAVAGLVSGYFVAYKPISNVVSAKSWVSESCTIVSSSVEESHDSDGSTYSVHMTFSYEFEGEAFEGEGYDFSIGSSSGYSGKAEIVEAYPAGMVTTCWVNPDAPWESVVNREPGLFLLWGLFPLPFLAVGVGGLAWILFFNKPSDETRKARDIQPGERATVLGRASAGLFAAIFPGRRRADSGRRAHGAVVGGATAQRSMMQGTSVQASWDDSRGWRSQSSTTTTSASSSRGFSGPLVLEAATSPKAVLIFLAIFTVFWNGIVAIFVTVGLNSSDGCFKLFIIPFVLAGIGLIGGTIYQALATTNPRPRLVLSESQPTLGTECSLEWRLEGRNVTLDKLTIKLEGREAATYTRGTDTTTDHETFFEAVLYDQVPRIRRGTVTVSIPEKTMPSFKADNNEIEWRISVRGDIPRWPDIREDFPFTVYPPSGGGA